MQRNEWEKSALGLGKPSPCIVLFFGKFKTISPSFYMRTREQQGEQRHMGNTRALYSIHHRFFLCLSLNQKSQARHHIKITHLGNSENHRYNHIETTPLRTIPAQLRGMAGQWLWSWEETLIYYQNEQTIYSHPLGTFSPLVHPVHTSDNFQFPEFQMCQCADSPQNLGQISLQIWFRISKSNMRNDYSYWDVVDVTFHQLENLWRTVEDFYYWTISPDSVKPHGLSV